MENKLLQQKKRFDSLQALRAFACLAVVVWHIDKIPLTVPIGGGAVSIFIILSGFLMAYHYCNRELECGIKPQLAFSWSKIKKLYPLHLATLIYIGIIVLISEWGNSSLRHIAFNLFSFLSSATLTQSWLPSKRIYFSYNGVAWYLSVCVFLYFVFPYLNKKLKKLSKKSLIFLAVSIYLIMITLSVCVYMIPINISFLDVAESFHDWFVYTLPIFRTGDFTIGCILGYLYLQANNSDTTPQKNKCAKYTFIEIIALVALAVSLYLSKIYLQYKSPLLDGLFNTTISFLPTGVLLVYVFAKNEGLITKVLTNKVTIYLGDNSAFIFLFHQLPNRTLLMRQNGLNGIEELLIILSVTLLFSELYRRLSKYIRAKKKTA